MQEENKRRRLTNSETLKNRLWVESVLNKPPLPYGSFEKAKYILLKHREPVYWFVTTCRNTEECVEIMKSKFDAGITQTKYCSIYKDQNGIRECIFTDKPSWML